MDFCDYVISQGLEWIEVKLEPVLYYSETDEDEVVKYLSKLS